MSEKLNQNLSEISIKQRISTVLHNKELADINFVIEQGTASYEFMAHKFVLSTASEVFYTMLYGSLAEKSGVIYLTDVEPYAFEQLLNFLYSDIENVTITSDNVKDIIIAAKKFDVAGLEKYCLEFLDKEISVDTVTRHLQVALCFELEPLKLKCLQFIDTFASDIFKTDKFYNLTPDELSLILRRDTLCVEEVCLFHAVDKWSKVECKRQQLPETGLNKREVLEDVLKLIRFPTMRLEIFTSEVAPCGLLTDEHELSLLRYFTYASNPATIFSNMPRAHPIQIFRANRYEGAEIEDKGTHYFGNQSRFDVDRKINLVGFGLRYWAKEYSMCTVSIKLRETLSRIVLAKNEIVVTRNASLDYFDVNFGRAVQLIPGIEYTAEFIMEYPIRSYGYPFKVGLFEAEPPFGTVTVETPLGKVTVKFLKMPSERYEIPQLLFSCIQIK